MKRSTSCAAFAVAMLTAPAAASDDRTQAVRHADLRLDRAADVRRLDLRIWRAAQAACGPVSDFDVLGKRLMRRCRTAAIDRVAAQRGQVIASARVDGARREVEVAARDAKD